MIIKTEELGQALKACSFIQKDKTRAGDWVHISRTSLSSHGIATRIEVAISSEGSDKNEEFLIHEKSIRDIVSSTREEKIELSASKKGVKVKSGSFKAEILTIDLSEFPSATKVVGGSTLKIETERMRTAIKSVAFAIAESVSTTSKLPFTGITLRKEGDKIAFIGAREPMIAVYHLDEKVKTLDCTFPEEFCRLVDRLPGDDMEISGLGQANVCIKSGNITATVTTYATPLPDVSSIVDRSTLASVTLPRDLLENAIASVSTIREPGKKQRVNLTFSKAGIRATVISPVLGKAAATVKGGSSKELKEDIRVGLDLANFTAILSKLDEDFVKLQLGEDNEILKIETSNSKYVAVIEIPDTDFEDEDADND